MSTKTTFKRVALVTVGALGLSLVAVAPSNAAVIQAGFRSLAFQSAPATATVGTAVSAVIKMAGSCVEDGTNGNTVAHYATLQIDVAPDGTNLVSNSVNASETLTALTGYTNTNATRNAYAAADWNGYRAVTAIHCVSSATAMVGYNKVTFTPDKAGTYVIVAVPLGATTGAATWTVVASAKTVGKSSAFIGTSVGASDTATADATVSVTAAASTTAKARIDVGSIYGTTGNETASAADAPSVVVATDKGLVSKTNDYSAGAKSVTTAAAVDADPSYWVFSNGDVGKASITITVGGVLLATKTVTFTGAATALKATLTTGQKSHIGPTQTTTLTITSTDAAATAVSNPSGLTVKSSDTAVATVVQTDNTTTTITGVKAGTAVITVTDPATTGTATAATYTITVAALKPTTAPTITFDKASYAVGELVTMTVGAAMADSATAQLFTSAGLVLSAAVVPSGTAVPTNGQHAIVAGVATYKFYAPAVSGTLTVTGTGGSDIDLTTLVTAPVVTKTVDITNTAVDAATAAGEAAEAAAQDATDAALDATTAAEAAGALAQEAVDLVTELSAEVTKLIAGVRASITYLTKLVMKLAAKK